MKVLHVLANVSPAAGGPAAAAEGMARAVAARGHEVTLCTTDWDDGGRFEVPVDRPVLRDGVAYRFFPVQRPVRFGTSWPMARALPALVAAADVVHLHSLYLFHDWAAARACRRAGTPYILRPHGSLDPYIWRRHRWRKRLVEAAFQDRVTRGAAALHFTSEDEMRLAEPYGHGVPGVVVPLGLDRSPFADLPPADAFRHRHPEVGERGIVLFFGRLDPKKGLDLLVPAFADAVRGGLDLHLVVAGPDFGMEDRTRAWLAAEGMTGRATFTGMVTGEDKLAVLAAADLFVLPSYSENFGISVVEAMAAGLPVVVSEAVNIWREVVADGAGLAVPCERAALARAIAALMPDPDRRRAMGAAGRDSVARRYDWDRIAARLEEVYRAVAAGRSADVPSSPRRST